MTEDQYKNIMAGIDKILSQLNTSDKNKSHVIKLTGFPKYPDFEIENPEKVEVHFGKNTGVPIGSLNDKQLLWYATDHEEKLNSKGVPFQPKDIDIELRNACRQLWWAKKNNTHSNSISAPINLTTQTEEVPF